ncbi:DUF6461 domain-containing protein [Streptomyces sp. NBC_01717]|uniref:DUF6461 domain-containing protein n=1 Tax=Streptomyces sp. NBC_01717 TaxID=2975918 RepID=UPI003FCDAA32
MSEVSAKIAAAIATTANYAWYNERFVELSRAYCMTLVHDLHLAALLRRLVCRARLHSPECRYSSTRHTNSRTDTRVATH